MNCSTWEIVGESLRLVHSNVDRQQVGLWEFDCIFFDHVFDHPFWKIQLKISKYQKIQVIRVGLYLLTGCDRLRQEEQVHQIIYSEIFQVQKILQNGMSICFDWCGSTEVKWAGVPEYMDFLIWYRIDLLSQGTFLKDFVWQKWRLGSFLVTSDYFSIFWHTVTSYVTEILRKWKPGFLVVLRFMGGHCVAAWINIFFFSFYNIFGNIWDQRGPLCGRLIGDY